MSTPVTYKRLGEINNYYKQEPHGCSSDENSPPNSLQLYLNHLAISAAIKPVPRTMMAHLDSHK